METCTQKVSPISDSTTSKMREKTGNADAYLDDGIDSQRLNQLVDLLGNPSAPSTSTDSQDATMQIDDSTSTSSPSKPSTSEPTTVEEDKEKAKVQEKEAKREMIKKKKLEEELKEIGDKLPEADGFISLLVLIKLLDQGEYEKVTYTPLYQSNFILINRRVDVGQAILD